MPYRYPPEFHRKVLELLATGRSVTSLSADPGVSDPPILGPMPTTHRPSTIVDLGDNASSSR